MPKLGLSEGSNHVGAGVRAVVAAARIKVREATYMGLVPVLKVAPETKLSREELLALIEGNDGPMNLDLSACSLHGQDLGLAALEHEKQLRQGPSEVDAPLCILRSGQ